MIRERGGGQGITVKNRMTCLVLPRPDLSPLYMPFLSCFLHGLYSRAGHFADTVYLFIILRTALRGSSLLPYAFYVEGHLKRGSHGGNRAPEKPSQIGVG